jgi:branched-chain amino acid transport system substrate-binding protein
MKGGARLSKKGIGQWKSTAFVGISVLLMLLWCFAGTSSAQKTIKVGICGPMKFPAGEHMWNGAQMAADEINSRGGIFLKGERYNVALFKADSNEYLSVTDAVNAFERLVTVDKVDFVVAGARSEAVIAQMESMADHKVIYLHSGGGSPLHTMKIAKDYNKYKYFFRMTGINVAYQTRTTSGAMHMIAEKIRKELGIQKPKVAICMEKIVVVDAMVEAAQKILPPLNMEICGIWRPSSTADDISAELNAIRSAGAQIIFTLFTGPVATVFGRQWGELQIPAAPVGTNVSGELKGYWQATQGKCEYETTLNVVVNSAVTKKSVPFWANYEKRFKEFPFYSAAGAYDGIYLMKETIERAQTKDSGVLIKELENADFMGVGGRMQFYPIDHATPHELKYGAMYSHAFLQQWQKGDLKTVYPDGSIPPAATGMGPGWEGLRYAGTVDYILPPALVKHWKEKK